MNLNLCVVLLVLQIIGYIFCFMKNIKWMWLCQMVFHTLCVAYPIALNFYLNQNAVSGLEALAGLAEVLLGLMILAVFGFTWLVSVITVLVKRRRMLGEAGKKRYLRRDSDGKHLILFMYKSDVFKRYLRYEIDCDVN